MNTVRWEVAWRCSILLTFLLLHVEHSNAINISIDGPYTPYRSSDVGYDFVDVAQQQNAANQQKETGQTSQFYTTDDVDETFWLKELGDDFKNAIHMQVGGEERQDGVFNMSENGAAYKMEHIQPIARTVVQNQMPKDKQGKQRKRNKTENNEGKRRQRKQKHEKNNEQIEKSIEHKSNATTHSEVLEMRTEENSTQATAQSKGLNGNAQEEDLKNYKEFQHIQIKYAPNKFNEDQQKRQIQHNQTLADQTIVQSPVVVNLPETGQVVELEANDAPVVVKMPPVIYHSKPANLSYPDHDENTDNRQTEVEETNTNTETIATQKAQKNNKDDINIDNMPDKQQTYTPTTYEQQQEQQYYQQHTQYTSTPNEQQQYSQPIEYKNIQQQQQQQQQHTQYPVPIQHTQYQKQQSLTYNQHEQQEQYSPATTNFHNNIPYHHNHGVYPSSDISSVPLYPSLSASVLEPTRDAKLRYMISKPTILATAPATAYGEYDAPQMQAAYNRDRRSTRLLYKEGL